MQWSIDEGDAAALHEQISACILRAIDDGSLRPGERLPPASELAAVLGVNPNTVLHAYRRLRDLGTLEFRRGRGARVAPDARARGQVVDAARHFLDLGRSHGYTPRALLAMIEELA